MSKITIAAYSIQLRIAHSEEYINFGEALSSKKDFIEFMQDFFDDYEKNVATDTEHKMLFRIKPNTIKKVNREFSGIIETGEYGYEANIIDRNTLKKKYTRQPDDAEMLPFYFLASMPKDKDVGFVLLQRFGLYGIADSFSKNLQTFIRSILPNIIVEFKPIMSEDILQKILRYGEIKKVTFTRFDIPGDLAKYYETGENNKKLGRLEFSMVANRNSGLKLGDRLNQLLFGAGKVNKLVQLHDFPYDSTKIVLQNGTDKRTFVIGDLLKFRAYYDISDTVVIGKDGHPVVDSVHKEAKNIQKEIENLLYPPKARNAG